MGDVMSLIEKAEAALDHDQAAEMQKKLKKMDFDFNDYLTSMEQMNKMGGIGSILNMLPGVGAKAKDLEDMIDEKALDRTKAIILSMTQKERSNPGILNISARIVSPKVPAWISQKSIVWSNSLNRARN